MFRKKFLQQNEDSLHYIKDEEESIIERMLEK